MSSKLWSYALGLLWRERAKSAAVLAIFAAIVFLLAATLFTGSSLKLALVETVDALPALTVQRMRAGRQVALPVDWTAQIATIAGVERAQERIWGYYYEPVADGTFTLLGLDPTLEQHRPGLTRAVAGIPADALDDDETMVVGAAALQAIRGKIGLVEQLAFIRPDGSRKPVRIAGSFADASSLFSGDLLLMSQPLARELLGVPDEYATDLVVSVANPAEVATVANKIKALFPDARIVSRAQMAASYRALFEYGSGLFLALSLVLLAAFFVLVFERASSLGVEERREIGVLRAVGWTVSDVLQVKLYQSLLLSLAAVLCGVALALAFVYGLGSPVLIDVFSGHARLRPSLQIPARLDLAAVAALCLAAIPVYLLATIVPAWRVAVTDPDESLR